MIARKLDSDFTVVRRMIRRETRNLIKELPSGRSGNFVQNYVFGTGGTGGFGGSGGTGTVHKTTGLVYSPDEPGVQYTQTRTNLQAFHGAYLQDAPGNDAINIVANVVNDPNWWLFGG